MNVPDLLVHIPDAPQVSVVSPAALPEPVSARTPGASVLHPRKEVGAMPVDPQQAAVRHRKLDRLQEWANQSPFLRPEDQVDVFGHEDVRPEVERVLVLGIKQRLCKPAAGAVGTEERLSVKAGESQAMDVVGDVPPFAPLSVSRRPRVHEVIMSTCPVLTQGETYGGRG
jgi:hypothetical protein